MCKTNSIILILAAALLVGCGPSGVEVASYTYTPRNALFPNVGTVTGEVVNHHDHPRSVTLYFDAIYAGESDPYEQMVPVGVLGAGERRSFSHRIGDTNRDLRPSGATLSRVSSYRR